MYKFSIIIPVYNRPDEVKELLESLLNQTYKSFEVIIVEDGSSVPCENIVSGYANKLDIKYVAKENTGPGLSRNYGASRANGDYYIFFDSDCIIPPAYLSQVNENLSANYVDAYGGPDSAHPSFTNTQKAINYSMTSFFTTGGIRGGKKKLDKFYPRSFNMGYSPEVASVTGGFSAMRFGEDIDMSIRIIENGFKTTLFEDAFVFHKRRVDLKKFFKQTFNSGIARINLYLKYPSSLRLVHALPSLFCMGLLVTLILSILIDPLFLAIIGVFIAAIFIDSSLRNKSLVIGSISIFSSFTQLIGYGIGFLYAAFKRLLFGKEEFNAFTKNFYK